MKLLAENKIQIGAELGQTLTLDQQSVLKTIEIGLSINLILNDIKLFPQ